MNGGEAMVYTISEIKEKAVPVARKFGIKKLSLFGSYARNEANEKSDLDFFINGDDLHGLIHYFSFVLALEDVFKRHVDVVTTGIKDVDFLNAIQAYGVLLYEE